ncbi:hypothetical protein [Gordoniibacillus kamchatkensis]|uniref:hypothetical protein n=1 Tax=Gordoniibacillus kamchatkensis TaxID=1590651 RepID=UPI000696616C|nr:hypothetical protein [Paenibacillus sp. VKM B-2647]
MKQAIGKKLLTTSLAAALLIGGGAALVHSTAYADNTASSSAQSNGTSNTSANGGKQHKAFGKFEHPGMEAGNVLKEAATLLGTDEKTLVQDLRGGKTLVQIAQDSKGWNEDTLVQNLSDAISKKLDEQVQSGKMTQAQADKAKANLADRVKKAVEGKFDFRGGMKGKRGGFEFGAANMQDLAAFLKLSETDLKAKLQEGQSLAAIAQAQGITEDALIAHIKDGMTDKIKNFVERTHKAKPEQAPSGQASSGQAPAASAQ